VDCNEFQPDPKKIAIVVEFPQPKTTTNVRTFLGLIRYYMRSIVEYAKITKPFLPSPKKNSSLFGHQYAKQLLH
jgi:hypothetical protein